MDFFRAHILTIVAFLPLAGAIVILFFDKENKNLIRWFANLVAFTGFLASVPIGQSGFAHPLAKNREHDQIKHKDHRFDPQERPAFFN